MAAKKTESPNLLDMIPVRTLEWDDNADGTITLKRPKFKNKFLTSIIQRLGKVTVLKIQLDSFGSLVWKQCDGVQTVEEIGRILKETYGSEVEPVYNRLGAFIRILVHQQCVVYKNDLDTNPPETPVPECSTL